MSPPDSDDDELRRGMVREAQGESDEHEYDDSVLHMMDEAQDGARAR